MKKCSQGPGSPCRPLLLTQPGAPGACALPGLDEPARIPGAPFEELQRRADSAWDAAHLPEALRFYRAGVELNPRWVGGVWRLGLLFWMAECDVEARDAFRRLLELTVELTPSGFAALLALGQALEATGSTEEAIVALEEAARLDPEQVDTFVALARAYQDAGRTRDVERARRRLTELYAKREGAE